MSLRILSSLQTTTNTIKDIVVGVLSKATGRYPKSVKVLYSGGGPFSDTLVYTCFLVMFHRTLLYSYLIVKVYREGQFTTYV